MKHSFVLNYLQIARKASLASLKNMVDSYSRTAEYALENPDSTPADSYREHKAIHDICKTVFDERMAQRNYEEYREETNALVEELTGKCEEYLENGTCIHSDHTL